MRQNRQDNFQLMVRTTMELHKDSHRLVTEAKEAYQLREFKGAELRLREAQIQQTKALTMIALDIASSLYFRPEGDTDRYDI